MPELVSVIIRLDPGADSDALETAELTHQLRNRLLEQGVERAELLHEGATPVGARAVDPTTIGSLLLLMTPGTVAGVIEVLKLWVERRHGRTIEVARGDVSVKITGGNQAEIQQVLALTAEHQD